MKNHLYIILPLLIAVALRLYPYATSSTPFSTDAWSPIKNAELLIQHSPINLGNDDIFDGYNNYWPANSLFGAVFSQITGVEPKQAMAIILPVIGSMTILIFYALVKRLYNQKISFIASIIFGTAFSHAYFTAAVTKETYANPLYLSLLLIFLHPTLGKQKRALLFTITSIALAMSHHFTAVITIALLFSIATAHLIDNSKKGLPPNRLEFLLASILTTTTALHYLLYAHAGFKFPLNLTDWLSAASYQTLTFTATLYLISKPYKKAQTSTIITTLGTVAIALLFPLFATKVPLAGFPTLPSYYMLYISPYFITLPFITLGYGYQKQIKAPIGPLFWLASLIGLEAYAVFSNSPLSPILWLRTPNFLYPPLAILAAAGLHQLYKTAKKPHLRKLAITTTITVIITIATINAYTLYASVSLQERYMGYQWLYRTQEYTAGDWIAATNSNTTIAGDIKISYLMQDYFHTKVDVLQGYSYLAGEEESPPQILFTYNQMLKNGYVIGYHGIDLPENWIEEANQLNRIYSNGLATLYSSENP